MNDTKNKCVLVLDASLPAGLAANAAAIMGLALGRVHPELMGEDVYDASGRIHAGIIRTPVPILRGDPALLRSLCDAGADAGVTVTDFTLLAQRCRSYEQFVSEMSKADTAQLCYLAVGLCGPAKAINRLTGSLPLLR